MTTPCSPAVEKTIPVSENGGHRSNVDTIVQLLTRQILEVAPREQARDEMVVHVQE